MLNLLDSFDETPEELIAKIKDPKSSDDFYFVALAYEKLEKHPVAEQMYRQALQRNMRHSPSLYGLALNAFKANREVDGKTWLTRAIRFDVNAEKDTLRFQRELKTSVPLYQNACRIRTLCMHLLEAHKKDGPEARFELAKLLFEQSKFADALPYFRALLKDDRFCRESAEYLSFALENLYRGEELLEKSLELAPEFQNRADLFFNLAMVCQHEQKRMDLALHFFYLASQEDLNDPGLRFSLEQAAMDVITESKKRTLPSHTVMFAHLYQGSVGIAKKYATEIRDFGPSIISDALPEKLWKDWLSVDRGTLGTFLSRVFG